MTSGSRGQTCGQTCAYGTCGGGPNPCGGCCGCLGGCAVEYELGQLAGPGGCPICFMPYGFHDEGVHGGPLPTSLAHLVRDPAFVRRAERPKGKPSDEEIARRREAKTLQRGDRTE